ncbi:TetR/AcrR family transcriptional regulator [Brevibacterium aurantiacum]|nr:TetR/AcrR family transcriptional regulator [Brevibacterium aurantiacum]PCC20436.1 TetR/AcrR family transcriptional regulator [Brevibacterium aurantiacum]PCC51199.1 TetR/AcrR family transcriptional regulator [Brevibacterium aurantiacum]PCC56427.1 TetR/AcrR family transcriptional regulator [Brevibacterium aurantiacum]RCS98180.1 TetR/AcrR family transcriptional regulator [Brevibacterium aurantiacum]
MSRARRSALSAVLPDVLDVIPDLSGTKSYQFAFAGLCCQDHSVNDQGRPYAGASREQRESARREQLVTAGISLFGTQGYRSATVGAVCAEAGLNKRYFYESFATLEDLLCEVYGRVVADLRASVLAGGGEDAAAVLRGFMSGFLTWAQANPVQARVHLFEVLGVSAQVDELYRWQGRTIGDELSSRLSATVDAPQLTAGQQRVLGDVLIGAGVQMVVNWVISDYQPPRDELLDEMDSTLGWVLAAGLSTLR